MHSFDAKTFIRAIKACLIATNKKYPGLTLCVRKDGHTCLMGTNGHWVAIFRFPDASPAKEDISLEISLDQAKRAIQSMEG